MTYTLERWKTLGVKYGVNAGRRKSNIRFYLKIQEEWFRLIP